MGPAVSGRARADERLGAEKRAAAAGPGRQVSRRPPRPHRRQEEEAAGPARGPPAGPRRAGAPWLGEARDLVRPKVDLTGCQPGSPPPPPSGSLSPGGGQDGRPRSPAQPPIGPFAAWRPAPGPARTPIGLEPPGAPPLPLTPLPHWPRAAWRPAPSRLALPLASGPAPTLSAAPPEQLRPAGVSARGLCRVLRGRRRPEFCSGPSPLRCQRSPSPLRVARRPGSRAPRRARCPPAPAPSARRPALPARSPPAPFLLFASLAFPFSPSRRPKTPSRLSSRGPSVGSSGRVPLPAPRLHSARPRTRPRGPTSPRCWAEGWRKRGKYQHEDGYCSEFVKRKMSWNPQIDPDPGSRLSSYKGQSEAAATRVG